MHHNFVWHMAFYVTLYKYVWQCERSSQHRFCISSSFYIFFAISVYLSSSVCGGGRVGARALYDTLITSSFLLGFHLS